MYGKLGWLSVLVVVGIFIVFEDNVNSKHLFFLICVIFYLISF
jgi:hypothetical protein